MSINATQCNFNDSPTKIGKRKTQDIKSCYIRISKDKDSWSSNLLQKQKQADNITSRIIKAKANKIDRTFQKTKRIGKLQIVTNS